ncbi:MAG TPA: nucleoside-diphosphate sugar epimerase/dehydratase [Gemmatimonadaceae bacterium]
MRNRFFFGIDVCLAIAVVFVSFTARFEGLDWWSSMSRMALWYIALAVPVKVVLFQQVGLYRRLWRYASIADLETLVLACLLGTVASFVIGVVLLPGVRLTEIRIPLGILVMDSALTAASISLPRLSLRILARHYRQFISNSRGHTSGSTDEIRRVLIAGAGDAGGKIAKELLENPQLGLAPVGFIDDDVTKHRHELHGIPVLGSLSKLSEFARVLSVSEVIIALPSARGKVIRDIVQASAAAGVRNRTVPGLYEILSGARSVSALRPIQIEDLLRRDPIETNLDQVSSLVTRRTVLVTGAGGSIGSELCRQLARLAPERIVALGRGENSIFELVQEMQARYPKVPVYPAIVDVRDETRLRAIFEETRPYSVFHAAAHKHVPLMEQSVDEAILNNVLGTQNVAELCAELEVEHLVLISTDKAVRPTSVMGATKRIAEQIIASVAERTGKPYVSVRFGNVLGSRGSVVPTFIRQIAAGGPVTVTHPEMRRYFMTIPEAVQLVLQAAALGCGGEVFVLDMGESVKIADLAQDLIRLSGLEVGTDIEIAYTGVRPGEKLYEELFFGPKDATPTSHPKVLQARDGDTTVTMNGHLTALIEAARRREADGDLRCRMHYLVPEYRGSVNGKAGSDPASQTPAKVLVPLEAVATLNGSGFANNLGA